MENSELCLIEENVFSNSSVPSIAIPSNANILKEGCFLVAKNWVNIIVSPENSNFYWFDDSFLLGVSNQNDDHYDALIFYNGYVK